MGANHGRLAVVLDGTLRFMERTMKMYYYAYIKPDTGDKVWILETIDRSKQRIARMIANEGNTLIAGPCLTNKQLHNTIAMWRAKLAAMA